MVQFKFVVVFFSRVWQLGVVCDAKYFKSLLEKIMVPLENGIVKHFSPFINGFDFQNRTRVFFQKLVSTFRNSGKNFNKVVVVANHRIVNVMLLDVAKCQIKAVRFDGLEQDDFRNVPFRAGTREQEVQLPWRWCDVISFPQHVQLIFCLVKNADKIQRSHNFFNSKNEMQ